MRHFLYLKLCRTRSGANCRWSRDDPDPSREARRRGLLNKVREFLGNLLVIGAARQMTCLILLK
ncbi:MAG: hypothetical protein ACK4MX_10485 [Thermaurantiacus sp.]